MDENFSLGICRKCKNPRTHRLPCGKPYCSPCYTETRKKYEKENQEKIKAGYRRYRSDNKEKVKEWKKAEYLRRHPLMIHYLGMRSRCNPNNTEKASSYADRQIHSVKMCDRWAIKGGQGFRNFVEDKYQSWKPGLTLDRWPDRNGDYSPENTRWATPKEQQNNTKLNMDYRLSIPDDSPIYYPYGILTTLGEFIKLFTIPNKIIRYRYAYNWDAEWILSKNVDDRVFSYEDNTYNMREIAILSNTPYGKVWGRMVTCKWTVEQVIRGYK